MNNKKTICYTVLFVFFLSLTWAGSVIQIVKASAFIPAGMLQSGVVIDNDMFTTGEQISIDGTIHGDVIVLGNQVNINGMVDGSLLVLGQSVDINGQVGGTTYVGAVSLELGSQSFLQRNLYFAGVSLTSQTGSVIQRDLKTICLSADINGKVTRETKAVIGILKLIERVIKKLGGEVFFSQLTPPEKTIPMKAMGGLLPVLSANLLASPAPALAIDPAQLTEWLLDRLRELGLLLVIGAVCLWLWRDELQRTVQNLRSRPLAALGYGLLALVIAFNIFLAGVLVAVLLFMIGLWIGNLGMWEFTLAFWALTYAALVFFLVVLWFLVAYGTKVVVAYLISSWLFEKIFPKATINPLISIIFGVVIYILFCSIPTLGWVLGVLATAWGLGGLWLAFRKLQKPVA